MTTTAPARPLTPASLTEAGATQPLARRSRRDQPLVISVIATPMVAYIGETVTVHLRLEASQPIHSAELLCALPAPLHVQHIHIPPPLQAPLQHDAGLRATLCTDGVGNTAYNTQEFIWSVAHLDARRYDVLFEVTIAHSADDPSSERWNGHPPGDSPALLDIEAEVRGIAGNGEAVFARQIIQISARGRSRWLRHLPSLYREDEFMGRWLILFERLWQPIEQQIALIDHYFDPLIAPPSMLRWLASWVDCPLENVLHEEQLRQWLRQATSLYRRRGTRAALQELLELYTGGHVEISEARAANLTLGKEARLGAGVALGKANHPHTFHVRVRMTKPEDPDVWERNIRRLIAMEKPAHTTFSLEVEYC